MAVTIQQIAQQAGVSRGTVDRALNHRGRIDPEVAKRIQETAREMGYVHKARKRKAGSVSNKKIGVVTQLAKASFMLEIRRGIETAKKELQELGIEVLIRESETVKETDQLQAIEELEKEGIEALAIMPVDSEKVREKLNFLTQKKNVPVVTFNSDIVGTKRICFVGMDNQRSGRTAAGLFRILTGGKGKVLIVTGYFSSPLNNSRVDGFVEEIREIAPELEIAGVQGSFNRTEEVKKIIENAMKNMADINGIFVVSGGQEGIREAFGEMNLDSDRRPHVIIYDQTPKNEVLLQEGNADFLIDQNGFEQGYRPLRLLADLLLNGEKPQREFYDTGIGIRTKYNL